MPFTTRMTARISILLVALLLILPAVPAAAQSPAADATAATGANLRAGPGTSFAIVGGAKIGDALEIVGRNADGSWYQLADGAWIFGQLVHNAPEVPVVGETTPAAGAESAPATAAPATSAPASAPAPAGGATLAADSTADWPGGKEHNFWAYLFTEGRNNFNWQEMRQESPNSCFKDTANLGLEVCSDYIAADKRGDVAVQWKASKGGTYRFEWDSASLKFYKHTELLGILGTGVELPYAATVSDVIEWEQFFWVAVDSTPYHIRIFKLDGAAAASPATAAIATFGSGMKVVSRDIIPGTYRAPGSSGCYWERLNGFAGKLGNIIANQFSAGPQIVSIAATDRGFYSNRCGTWTLDLSPIRADPSLPFGDGTYFVGKDIAPGTWQASGTDGCYWETLSNFSGQFRDIHANDFLVGGTVVDIRSEDTGFHTSGCGTWTKID